MNDEKIMLIIINKLLIINKIIYFFAKRTYFTHFLQFFSFPLSLFFLPSTKRLH